MATLTKRNEQIVGIEESIFSNIVNGTISARMIV